MAIRSCLRSWPLTWIAFLGVALSVMLFASNSARACSPWPGPAVDYTLPANNAVHPRNAPIMIVGHVLDTTGLTATVDGEPVALVVDERSTWVNFTLWGRAEAITLLRLDPQPSIGQRVQLTGDICPPKTEELGSTDDCPFELNYEVGPAPAQVLKPEFELNLWYDVYDHEEVGHSYSTCESPSARYGIDFSIEFDRDFPEAPLYFEIRRRPRDKPGAWRTFRGNWRLSDDGPAPSFLARYIEIQQPLAEAYCFELRTEDLDGNPGPAVERCLPCHDQVGLGSGFIDAFPDGPPAYGDAGLYPTGECPLVPEGSTTGEGTTGWDTTGGESSTSGMQELPAEDAASSERITVESGDGTKQGTTRMVMHGTKDEVEVGRADRALRGTYIHVEGLRRAQLPHGFRDRGSGDRPYECGVIEERCLAAPVPIIVNSVPVFGISSQRSPSLFGYQQTVAFDEGDFYGTLGIWPKFNNAAFRLLKWGVAIQSRNYPLAEGYTFGGIICFNALHKTVDHSGIVADDRLAELWIRLQPYAQQLITAESDASTHHATRLDGSLLGPSELRAVLRDQPRVVLVEPGTGADPDLADCATSIGSALGAPVLCAPIEQIPTLRVLSTNALQIIQPDLTSVDDLSFYTDPPDQPPKRPWLTPPVEVAPIGVGTLAQRMLDSSLHAVGQLSKALCVKLGGTGDIEATVYTPAIAVRDHDTLEVQVLTTDRCVLAERVPSAYPGHVLVVRLPDVRVAPLLAPIDGGTNAPCVAAEVARTMAEHAASTLAAAFSKAVARLSVQAVEPGSAAAALGVAAVARTVLPRLRTHEGRPAVDFSALEASRVDLLSLSLWRTVAGTKVTLRELAGFMNQCHGLVYGIIPSVAPDLEGLDTRKILALDEADERLLLGLLGDGAYVRIDRRDVLAHYKGVRCRDLALGLRAYGNFPLLVEGEDPTDWPQSEQDECIGALVGQLSRRFLGADPPMPSDPAERGDWEECRRQACRQLQWLLCTQTRLHAELYQKVADLPLFLDGDQEPRSFRTVHEAVQHADGLLLHYGHAFGAAELGRLAAAALQGRVQERESSRLTTLAADPFVHRLLHGLGRVRPAFDFELATVPSLGSDDPESFAVSVEIDEPGFRGRIGVARDPAARPDIVVLLPGRQRARALAETAVEHHVVGWVRLDEGAPWDSERLDAMVLQVGASAKQALVELMGTLPDAEPETLAAHSSILLNYAARHLVFTANAQGITTGVVGDLVGRILALPLFPSKFGGFISAWRLVRRFAGLADTGDDEARERVFGELVPQVPEHLSRWLKRTFNGGNVVRQPGRAVGHLPMFLGNQDCQSRAHLRASLEHWLWTLRPDHQPKPQQIWFLLDAAPGDDLLSGAAGDLRVSAEHWLVEWASDPTRDQATGLAWLLLGIYAHINAVLERVTNAHERSFQTRVLAALDAGELKLLPVARDAIPNDGAS